MSLSGTESGRKAFINNEERNIYRSYARNHKKRNEHRLSNIVLMPSVPRRGSVDAVYAACRRKNARR